MEGKEGEGCEGKDKIGEEGDKKYGRGARREPLKTTKIRGSKVKSLHHIPKDGGREGRSEMIGKERHGNSEGEKNVKSKKYM